MVELSDQGHKTICYAHSPDVVDLLVAELRSRGIEAVAFHGKIPRTKRLRALDARFRHGPAPVLVATYGVCQKGYNIHQADRVVLYDRDWTNTTEEQAIARVLRPQQGRPVHVEAIHLEGSLDEYQDQMTQFKAGAMRAGLDYGADDPTTEFLHMETILSRFLDDFTKRYGTGVLDAA